MGKIKGWRIDHHTRSASNYNASGKEYNNLVWVNTRNESKVFVWSPRYINANHWQVSDGDKERNFKTKEEAIRFATNYMRSHPNG